MTKLNLPEYQFRIKNEKGKRYIFDDNRKKYVVLTPEEWVRQNFIKYLIEEKDYSKSLISVEMTLILNKTSKRCDIVCFNNQAKPILIVECKAPLVKITQKAFDQISRYNLRLKVPNLVVTNGLTHYCCAINYEKQTYSYLKEIPSYGG